VRIDFNEIPLPESERRDDSTFGRVSQAARQQIGAIGLFNQVVDNMSIAVNAKPYG
jgi:hypothetical protein